MSNDSLSELISYGLQVGKHYESKGNSVFYAIF